MQCHSSWTATERKYVVLDRDCDDDRNDNYYTSQHGRQIQTKWQQFPRYLVEIQIITMVCQCRVVGLDDTMTCVCMMELTCTKEQTDIVFLFLWSFSLCFHFLLPSLYVSMSLEVGWMWDESEKSTTWKECKPDREKRKDKFPYLTSLSLWLQFTGFW